MISLEIWLVILLFRKRIRKLEELFGIQSKVLEQAKPRVADEEPVVEGEKKDSCSKKVPAEADESKEPDLNDTFEAVIIQEEEEKP